MSSTGQDSSLLLYDFDLYQRYQFMKQICEIVFDTEIFSAQENAISVLDVGSGSSKFTSEFLGSRFVVTRSDVENHQDSSICLLVPGQPLPFENSCFDLVVAQDVLEHVLPEHRSFFIDEVIRVSKHIVIMCCPNNHSEVKKSEQRIEEIYKNIFKKPHRFLNEHFMYELPSKEFVKSTVDKHDVLIYDFPNVLLKHWEIFTLLDLVLYGKNFLSISQELHQEINQKYNPWYKDGIHYREMFFILNNKVMGEVLAKHLTGYKLEHYSDDNEAITPLDFLANFCSDKMFDLREIRIKLDQYKNEVKVKDLHIIKLEKYFRDILNAQNEELKTLRKSVLARFISFIGRSLRK
jgi:hypothetical protein